MENNVRRAQMLGREGGGGRLRDGRGGAKRAEQVSQDARAKRKSGDDKPARVAMEEIAKNTGKWQLAPPVEEESTALETEE